jgi:hypothetical protein
MTSTSEDDLSTIKDLSDDQDLSRPMPEGTGPVFLDSLARVNRNHGQTLEKLGEN